MPNNFKLSGDYYVSKFGNDSWDGLTPDTPKRTVQAGLNLMTTNNKTLIIGAGVYKESISRVVGVTGNVISADGIVVMEGLTGLDVFNISYGSVTVNNIIFRNYSAVYFQATSTRGDIVGCTIYGDVFSRVFSYTLCRFINSDINFTGAADDRYNYCIFINCSLPTTLNANIITNCYVNTSSIIGFTGTAVNFNYNNIQGSIIMNTATAVTTGTYQDIYGRYYNLSIAGNNTSLDAGTLGNPYYRSDTLGKAFSYTNHKILYPTYNVNSISQDPLFNNLLSQDFTLQSGSPHIGRASDGINNIGGTRYTIRAAVTGSFSGSGATVDAGLTFSYDNYVISGSAVTGSVTSAPIFISSSAKVIQEIDYNGLLAFNKTTSSFFYSGSNVNVPDFDTYTSASGNPGANPDRLVYYMRLTTGSVQPVVDADWENGNLWTRGDYNVFEWNTKPSIDIYGRGNGDPNFVVANSSFLRATYIQMKVKLRNDYLQ